MGNGARAFRQCNYVDNEVDSALSLILKLKLMSEHDIAHPLAKVKLIDYVWQFLQRVKKSFFQV